MRLIDCFSDIITYTLYLLQNVGDGEVENDPAQWAQEKEPNMQQLPAEMKPLELKPLPSQQDADSAEDGDEPEAQSEKVGDFSFNAVYENYRRLFNNCTEQKRKGNFPAGDFDLAKFAVCAWVDEVINLSGWDEKMKWPNVELQRQFFMTTNAGEEFFQKLCALKRPQTQVLEVYATCLALGFKGCYYQRFASEELNSIRRSACSRFLGYSPEEEFLSNRKFFPQSYATSGSEEVIKSKKRSMRWAAVACSFAAPVVVLITLQLVFNNMLGRVLADLLAIVNR